MATLSIVFLIRQGVWGGQRWSELYGTLLCADVLRLWRLLVFVEPSRYGQTTATCSCLTGTRPLHANSGGDSSPLIWKFEAYRKRSGGDQQKQVICYVRQVENDSRDEIRDILWHVAGYRRDVIPAHAPRSSCTDYAGEMRSSLQQGPLYHGVSSHTP
jgi:hypothetical protein